MTKEMERKELILSSSERTGKGAISRRRFLKGMAVLGVGTAGVAGGHANSFGAESQEKWGRSGSIRKDGALTPPVSIPEASIFMKSPDSVLVGVTTSEVIEIKLADVLKFHGYCAGGVAFSFRAAQEAFRILYGDTLPLRQNLKVQTSHHCCQAGALAYITGARTDFGAISNRGDLVLLPEDSKKIVFIDKKTGERVELRPRFNPHDIFAPLFQKVRKDPSFAPQVQKTLNDAVQTYIYGSTERLFQIMPERG